MRRKTVPLATLLVILLLTALSFQRGLKRWLPGRQPAVLPVAAPGAAPVEGPYFSDRDRVADRIIAATNRTQKSLHVAIYDLTHPEITAALEAAHRRGVEILIVADERQSREPHSEIPYLLSQGLAIRLSRGYKGKDRKSTRLNSSHSRASRMPSSA